MVNIRHTTAYFLVICLFSNFNGASSLEPDESVFKIFPKSQPFYVSEGLPGPLLECSFTSQYSNRSRYEAGWTSITDGLPKHLTRNNILFAKDLYDLVQTDGKYSLRIKSVQFQHHNGKFYCTILDKETGAQKTAQANVIVMVEPDDPVITKQPSSAVHEHDLVTFECQSKNGNPPPKFSWIFDNKTVVPSEWYQEKAAGRWNQSSISYLQWRITAKEHDSYLICQVTNEALPEGEFKNVSTNRLNVLYAPRVTAGPVHDYNVEEGDTVELLCVASGNPEPTNFEWYHVTTGERHANAAWSFVVEKKHAGEFRCMATNAIDSGVDKLTLNVLYAPLVKIKERYSPREGETVSIECIVDANPQTDDISWILPSGKVYKGSEMVIDAINRSSSGNYTCSSTNKLTVFRQGSKSSYTRTKEATTIIDVLYKPGRGKITSLESVIAVGEKTELFCNATETGSPKAEFRWATPAKNGAYGSNSSPTLTVDHATLHDNGEYRCLPYNQIGDGEEGVFMLQVIEKAKITRGLPNYRNFNAGDSTVALICEADGYPSPIFHWYKDGKEILGGHDSQWMIQSQQKNNNCPSGDFCSISVVSTLRFLDVIVWSDKGNYTCVAENGFQDKSPEGSSMEMTVMHDPVILNERFPTDSLEAYDLHTTAELKCAVSARPEPHFTWIRNSSKIRDGQDRYTIRNTPIESKIDEYQSILDISNVDPSDYGQYLCRAANGVNSKTDLMIKLQTRSKPYIPSDVKLMSSASTWFVIGWKPGFHGGAEQTFHLEFRKADPWKNTPDGLDSKTFDIKSSDAPFVTFYGEPEDDFGHHEQPHLPIKFVVHNISKLMPLTSYWFRVRSKNLLGESHWTPVALGTTTDVFEDPDIEPPHSIEYNNKEKQIEFRPSVFDENYCLLLMISTESVDNVPLWRAVDCFTENPIRNIEAAEKFKARFCYKHNISSCSKSSQIIELGEERILIYFITNRAVSTLMTSTLVYIIPLAIVFIALLFAIFIFILCCHSKYSIRSKLSRKNYIGDEKKLEVSAPMQQSETKDTLIHASQTDSGIFAVQSIPNGKAIANKHANSEGHNYHADPFSAYTNGGADNWCSVGDSIDFGGQTYLQDYGHQFITPQECYRISPSVQSTNQGSQLYNEYNSNMMQPVVDMNINTINNMNSSEPGSSDSTVFSANGGARIMREIIV